MSWFRRAAKTPVAYPPHTARTHRTCVSRKRTENNMTGRGYGREWTELKERVMDKFQPDHYPAEILGEDDDDGTMPANVATLAEAVVGHRIVKVERNVEIPKTDGRYWGESHGTEITLDNGKRVFLADGGDCCAYTSLEDFLLHADKIDHIITGVGTTEGYTKWHVYADLGDVLELTVGWSCGNPFYYGYGFDVVVRDSA
jgi:hypothetical protein